MTFSADYFKEVQTIAKKIDIAKIDQLAIELAALRKRKGRLFILGIGGSAANASHAVNDFRKLCSIEAYAPTDNVSHLTAVTNDDGWKMFFIDWLHGSNISENDAIFILSVGGGNQRKKVSVGLSLALVLAKKVGAKIFGIVGRTDGDTYKMGNLCICIPSFETSATRVTPHAEGFQSIIWHCLVSNPLLQTRTTKW